MAVDIPRQKDQILSSRTLFKTVVQAHKTEALWHLCTPGDQSGTTALPTLSKRLAERQRYSSSHGVGRKHQWCSRRQPTRYWGHTYKFLIGKGSWRVGVGCGRTGSYTIVILLGVTPLYPFVVKNQQFRVCLNNARRCYFSPAVLLHEPRRFSFQQIYISRRPFLCLQKLVSSFVDRLSKTDGNWDSLKVHPSHHLLGRPFVSGPQPTMPRALETVDGRESQDQNH